jgi:hypothetical protein
VAAGYPVTMAAMPTPPEETPQPPTAEPSAGGAEAVPAEPQSWRRFLPRRRAPAEAPPGAASANGDGPPDQPTEVIPPPPRPDGPARLRRERRRLLASREQAVYHLGGLAFELYRRDQLGEEVMRRRAGEVAMLDDTVRDIDNRLGEIDRDRKERRRRTQDDGVAGHCLTCRAPFRAEARFCWQCGTQLVPASQGDEQVTAVITPAPDPPREPEGA